MEFDMDNNCQLVVFSDKAYNAIIRETFEWDPVETGGILLGHVLDNGCWIVMENLPPGYGEPREGDRVFHEYGYFEYNSKFVNYLAKSVAEQYKTPLELLGLWHRHPGSMDHFSETDHVTNSTFAAQNPNGVISGLVNVDPQLRMTMYYLPYGDRLKKHASDLNYQQVKIEVGSDLIPEKYFVLRYFQGKERDLHPYAPKHPMRNTTSGLEESGEHSTEGDNSDNSAHGGMYSEAIVQEQNDKSRHDWKESPHYNEPNSFLSDITESFKKNKQFVILILAIWVCLISLFIVKIDLRAFFGFSKEKQVLVSPSEHKSKKTKELNKEGKKYNPEVTRGVTIQRLGYSLNNVIKRNSEQL